MLGRDDVWRSRGGMTRFTPSAKCTPNRGRAKSPIPLQTNSQPSFRQSDSSICFTHQLHQPITSRDARERSLAPVVHVPSLQFHHDIHRVPCNLPASLWSLVAPPPSVAVAVTVAVASGVLVGRRHSQVLFLFLFFTLQFASSPVSPWRPFPQRAFSPRLLHLRHFLLLLSVIHDRYEERQLRYR